MLRVKETIIQLQSLKPKKTSAPSVELNRNEDSKLQGMYQRCWRVVEKKETTNLKEIAIKRLKKKQKR